MASWGLYIMASMVLVVAMTPVLTDVRAESAAGSGARYLQGVAALFSCMKPGVAVVFHFGDLETQGEIRVSGDQLVYTSGETRVTIQTGTNADVATLHAGVAYSATMKGSVIEVTPLV